MSEERRLAVLRAIVQDYVRTSEPVGSKSLVERHHFGVSAATVRNDMAILEEEGLIAAPHTSAGRVPTDAGYRLFVDRLSAVKPMTPAERVAIQRFLAGAVDLDDVVDRTVRLLASLTHQVAIVQYPSLSRSAVRHIELVALGRDRLLVVLIATTGRVEQRIVDTSDTGQHLDDPTGQELVARIRAAVLADAAGLAFPEASGRLQALPERFEPAERDLVRAVLRTLDDALAEQREERVVLAGTSNLARFGADFPTSIAPVLEALEEHVVLLKLFGQLATHAAAGELRGIPVAVTIGHENPHAGLAGTSVVSAAYGSGSELVAGLGVLGPTRMDYPTTMATVRAVARYVSDLLEP
ncbi:MAG TPA: heat-inducible transcriptional repressor HrcA [Dermatophilaceae bacterium]|nr:heat-inducible transcriptional repressor HrcA [Dermatophilaceae bacterium]